METGWTYGNLLISQGERLINKRRSYDSFGGTDQPKKKIRPTNNYKGKSIRKIIEIGWMIFDEKFKRDK